jgi:hypothetical protein
MTGTVNLDNLLDDLEGLLKLVNDSAGGLSYQALQDAMTWSPSLHLINYIRFCEAQAFLDYDRVDDLVTITPAGASALDDSDSWADAVREHFADQLSHGQSDGGIPESTDPDADAATSVISADDIDMEAFPSFEEEPPADAEPPSEETRPSFSIDPVDPPISFGDTGSPDLTQDDLSGPSFESEPPSLEAFEPVAFEPEPEPEPTPEPEPAPEPAPAPDAPAAVTPTHDPPAATSTPMNAPHTPYVSPYTRTDEIGSGGIGTVYKGMQTSLNRAVAIKEIRDIFHVFADVQRDDIVQRFVRIVQQQAQLAHPNIVRVLDVVTEAEYPFLVMDLAHMGNLRRLIEVDDRPPLAVAMRYFLQILHALNTAHDAGIIHGGLKPENVVLDASGNAKLTDFGMSGIVERAGGGGNQVYVGVGTVAYMSPEQFRDPNLASVKSDIYSLGIMFYEMLTGKVPGRRSPMPSSFYPDIPRALDDVFDRMSIDNMDDRYASIDEILQDIYSSQEVMDILDKRGGVLFLRDPLTHGLHGLGEVELPEIQDAARFSETSALPSVDNGAARMSEAVEEALAPPAAEPEPEPVEEEVELPEVAEEGDVLDKLDKYGALFDEEG